MLIMLILKVTQLAQPGGGMPMKLLSSSIGDCKSWDFIFPINMTYKYN
jgi:hypothetical protein